MQARIVQDGDVFIVYLVGQLDIETAEPFREACFKHLIARKVVFSFHGLSFVGSSGILPFLETMCEFAQKNRDEFKFCSVGSEFRKILSTTSLAAIEIHDDTTQAVRAFHAVLVLSPSSTVTTASSSSFSSPSSSPSSVIEESVSRVFRWCSFDKTSLVERQVPPEKKC